MKRTALALALAPALAVSSPALALSSAAADDLANLLRRAGEYVVEYESAFSALVAEEAYEQWAGDPAYRRLHRRTRADLVFVRLAGEFPWASYRDVFEVDSRRVREPDDRLVRLLAENTTSARERAEELLRASSEYNIGPVKRTLNLPTLPLLFLHPRNQPRFTFTLGERQTIGGRDAVELVFEETERPTLVKGRALSDLPASGRFWVEAGRGSVVRSETTFRFGGGTGYAHFTTDYRPEPALAMWVPSEMRESYGNVKGLKKKKGAFAMPLECQALYRRFRRFTITTEEKATVPEPPEPEPPPAEPPPEPSDRVEGTP